MVYKSNTQIKNKMLQLIMVRRGTIPLPGGSHTHTEQRRRTWRLSKEYNNPPELYYNTSMEFLWLVGRIVLQINLQRGRGTLHPLSIVVKARRGSITDYPFPHMDPISL